MAPEPHIVPNTLAAALRGLAQSRDAQCWEALVSQAGGEIFELARRIVRDENLADDVTQETLLRVRDCAEQFKPDGATDANTAARRWIMRIACTSALKLLRTRRRGELRDTAYAQSAPAETTNPADAHAEAETSARVRQEVEALPERERLPILCHYYAGMPYEEIATHLGCPVGTAKTHVHRGLEKLRTRLAVLGVVAPLVLDASWIEPALRAPVSAAATPIQLAKWKALLTAPKAAALAGATTVTTGGLSLMAKVCLGSAAALLAAAAAVTIPRAFSASTPTPPAPLTPATVAAPRAATPVAAATPAPAPAMAQWEVDLRARLQRKVTFEFVDQSVGDCANFLTSLSKVEIEISAAARAKIAADKKTVTMRVSEMSMERSLQFIAYWTDLEVRYVDGVVRLDVPKGALKLPDLEGTPDGVEARRKFQRRVTFDFVDTSLDEAVAFLRQISGVTVILKPNDNAAAVNLRFSEITMEDALFWITALGHTSFQWKDNAIFIAPTAPDAGATELGRKLTLKVADTLAGMPADKALELLCQKANVTFTITPEAAALLKDKTVAADAALGANHTAGVILELLAEAQGLDIKVAGSALRFEPHTPARGEGDAMQKINSGLKINLAVLTNTDGTPELALTELEHGWTPALQKTIADSGLIHNYRNGAIGIGAPVEIWKLEELPAFNPGPAPAAAPTPVAPETKKAPAVPGEKNEF